MDALIDVVAGDYIWVDGAAKHDPAGGIGNAVFLRLMTPLGSYWADVTLGSRLHELQREKDLSRVGLLAKQYAEMALAPIVADGRVLSVKVAASQPHDGRLHLKVGLLAASGEQFEFNHAVKVI